MTNKTTSVRLPKSAPLPEGVASLDTRHHGGLAPYTPSAPSWAAWFEGEGVSADFMVERAQPAEQTYQGV